MKVTLFLPFRGDRDWLSSFLKDDLGGVTGCLYDENWPVFAEFALDAEEGWFCLPPPGYKKDETSPKMLMLICGSLSPNSLEEVSGIVSSKASTDRFEK